MRGYRVITQENVSYHFMVHDGELLSIGITNERGVSRRFYVEAEKPEDMITTDLFETAAEALLRGRPDAFNLVSRVAPEPYSKVAVRVYKKVMDELYNLAIADVAFKRHSSSIVGNVNATYTLFEEE